MPTTREIINDWASKNFGEPLEEHKHLFWESSMTGWLPTQEAVREYKNNPVPEKSVTVDGHTLQVCSGWNCALVQLPSGEWVESRSDGIWGEYNGGWVVCWVNDTNPVGHIFKI